MNTTLTPQQIEAYRRDGVLPYPGLLNTDEVAELKAAVLEAIATMGKRKVAGDGADVQEGDYYYDRVFTQRLNLWRINEVVKRTMLNRELGRMLCQLEGQKGFRVYPEMATIDPIAFPMKPGDCSFHNGLTAHGAGANMTRGRRIAMTCAYMPVGSTFNGEKNILPDDYFKSLQKGDVLDNDTLNPIVHAE